MHLGKFDPTQEGYQVVSAMKNPRSMEILEQNSGMPERAGYYIIFPETARTVGRCMVADVDPDSPGCEYWSSEPDGVMYSCKGNELTGKKGTYSQRW